MGADTTLGSGLRVFPATTLGLVTRLHSLSPEEQGRGLELLCRRYWKPVYYYVRIAWAKSNEEAKDLTQSFFLWLLEGDALHRYAPERGSFRPYLKTLLRRFVGHREVSAGRIKRGGHARILPLDDGRFDPEMAADYGKDPEKAFDDAWASELVRQAVDRIRRKARGGERDLPFRVFELHDLTEGGEPPSYADVGRELGLKEAQVRDYLFTIRRQVREEIRAELGRLTSGDPEMEEEWRLLFGPA